MNVSLCSMDCLNWQQRVNQWSSFHKWHLGVAFIISRRFSFFALEGSPPWVAKLSLRRGLQSLEVFPWFLRSVLIVPNTGWFKALAFDSTKLAMSSSVISLCLLFVISSAASRHLCLNGKESLSITLLSACCLDSRSCWGNPPLSMCSCSLWEGWKTAEVIGHLHA